MNDNTNKNDFHASTLSNETDAAKSKSLRSQERVTISEHLKLKLDAIVQQANESFDGVITITKSDIINLFIKQHDEKLSPIELQQLHRDHYDEIKVATWLLEKVKIAKKNGNPIQMQELLSSFSAPLKERKKRQHPKTDESQVPLLKKPRKKKNELKELNSIAAKLPSQEVEPIKSN